MLSAWVWPCSHQQLPASSAQQIFSLTLCSSLALSDTLSRSSVWLCARLSLSPTRSADLQLSRSSAWLCARLSLSLTRSADLQLSRSSVWLCAHLSLSPTRSADLQLDSVLVSRSLRHAQQLLEQMLVLLYRSNNNRSYSDTRKKTFRAAFYLQTERSCPYLTQNQTNVSVFSAVNSPGIKYWTKEVFLSFSFRNHIIKVLLMHPTSNWIQTLLKD